MKAAAPFFPLQSVIMSSWRFCWHLTNSVQVGLVCESHSVTDPSFHLCLCHPHLWKLLFLWPNPHQIFLLLPVFSLHCFYSKQSYKEYLYLCWLRWLLLVTMNNVIPYDLNHIVDAHWAIKSVNKISQIDKLDNPIEVFIFKEIIETHENSR